jgi:hypothetical protein
VQFSLKDSPRTPLLTGSHGGSGASQSLSATPSTSPAPLTNRSITGHPFVHQRRTASSGRTHQPLATPFDLQPPSVAYAAAGVAPSSSHLKRASPTTAVPTPTPSDDPSTCMSPGDNSAADICVAFDTLTCLPFPPSSDAPDKKLGNPAQAMIAAAQQRPAAHLSPPHERHMFSASVRSQSRPSGRPVGPAVAIAKAMRSQPRHRNQASAQSVARAAEVRPRVTAQSISTSDHRCLCPLSNC